MQYLARTLDDGNLQDICPIQADAYMPMIQPLRHEKAVILLVDRAGNCYLLLSVVVVVVVVAGVVANTAKL